MPIRSPIEWGWDMMRQTGLMDAPLRTQDTRVLTDADLTVRRISAADVTDALTKGFEDFGSSRTDVIFLCIVYPVIGLVLGRLAWGGGLLPLLFPLAAGFALLGPLAAVGLNEMSRRRETTGHTRWLDTFGVLRAQSIGGILLLGLLMVAIFLVWMAVAAVIFEITLGPDLPVSVGGFAHDVFGTVGGWALIVLGMGVGFVFAVIVLAISVVSFPLMLDRRVSAGTAIRTSIRVVTVNREVMALWGAIVAVALVAGSIPLFIGLTVVLPVLGHATWHLYRKVVAA